MLKKKFFKTKTDCEVTFEYETDSSQTVALVTEANGWEPVEMKKRKADGVYYTKIRLPKENSFQYRYLLDGQSWVNDPSADAYMANEFGDQNSIVVTTPSSN
jgi:1,4-alpha-glucan branching enzyme